MLTPQEIATGVLNPDRTVADVQSVRANVPFGIMESMMQQARRNEARIANDRMTSQQIEAQAHPSAAVAQQQPTPPSAPARKNYRTRGSGVAPKQVKVNKNKSDAVSSDTAGTNTIIAEQGDAGISNKPLAELEKEMAGTPVSYDTRHMQAPDAATYAYGGRRNFDDAAYSSANSGAPASSSEANDSVIPELIMAGILGTAGVGGAYAFPKILNSIDEAARAATAAYNTANGYGESMSARDMKNAKARARYAGNKAWNNTSPEEKARINEEAFQRYKEKVKAWAKSGLSWEEFNAQARATSQAGEAASKAAAQASEAAAKAGEAGWLSKAGTVAKNLGDLAYKAYPLATMPFTAGDQWIRLQNGDELSSGDVFANVTDPAYSALTLGLVEEPVSRLKVGLEGLLGMDFSEEDRRKILAWDERERAEEAARQAEEAIKAKRKAEEDARLKAEIGNYINWMR